MCFATIVGHNITEVGWVLSQFLNDGVDGFVISCVSYVWGGG